jgi:tetratricopeptide (TPR) repeat protein
MEAAQPLLASMEADVRLEDWGSATQGANNLSELYLTSGDVAQALDYARKSVELADRSRLDFHRVDKRSVLADALFQAGRVSEAEAVLQEAEKICKKFNPQLPQLLSLPGFRYCALLLHQGKYQEVIGRALTALSLDKKLNAGLLTVALDHLTFGRAYMLRARDEGYDNDLYPATGLLYQAVEILRQARQLNMLPLGLLARAELHRLVDEFGKARDDLDEAMSIASRGGMGLYQADCHLGYAQLYLAEGEKEKARGHWRTAKEMIGRMGYHLRDGDVEEIGRELEGA